MPAAEPDGYDEWLERLRTTYESVEFTCRHRLRQPVLAREVSMHVLAGMLARPSIFRYFGLPYSGRIAHLAEERIAAAERGDPVPGPNAQWVEVLGWLRELPDRERELFVLSCVRGCSTAEIAELLDESPAAVDGACAETLTRIRAISARITPDR